MTLPNARPFSGAAERPIRVLFFDHERRLSGGQQDLVDLIAALDRSRVEVHVALPGSGPLEDSLRRYGASVHHVEMSRALRRLSRWSLERDPLAAVRNAGALAGASMRFGRLIRRIRPDVVHTNSMKAHFVAVPAALSLRVPLVWHIRDILAAGWMRRVLAATGRIGARRIICLSNATASQFASSPVWRRVRVVYNGIHLNRFDNARRDDWRSRLGAAEGDVVVGMIGQIARWKGQDVFIDAAAKVLPRCPEALFVIVGECLFAENEAEFDRSIRERAERLGLSQRLTWTGWVDDIPGVVGAIDVLVHASREPEPFGRVLVEGMAAGKAVVTTTIGAGPEIVPPAVGRLIPADDPDALAGALVALVADPAERARCGAAAAAAARRFDIAETARAVVDVYCEILPCA